MVAMQASMDELQRVVNHVFLPPKLPQEEDDASDVALLDATYQALTSLSRQIPPDTPLAPISHAMALPSNMMTSMPSGKIDEEGLRKVLLSLAEGQTVAVKVRAQNAAVLITPRSEELLFEAFELSPQDRNKGQIGANFSWACRHHQRRLTRRS